MSRFYAGIDLSARSSWLCVLDEAGHCQLNRKVPHDELTIACALEPFLPELSAAVESTFNWYWMVDLLQDIGAETKLAHPLYLKAIAYAKVKTDQVDAHTLAQLLRTGYLPEAYIYPRGTRSTRDLLRQRHSLVALRGKFYRDLQLYLMRNNVDHFSRNSIKQLEVRELRSLLPDKHSRLSGTTALRMIRSLDEEIQQLDDSIQASVWRKPPVVHLKTLPGVGKVLGATVYYETGEVDRFPSDKTYASYCRVAPTIAQSGPVTRVGRNRKQGNHYLKWAFSEAAQMAIVGYPAIREYAEKLEKKKRKRVLVKAILAHKIAIAAYHVLKNKEPYRPGTLLPV